jgi:hypothetical protein
MTEVSRRIVVAGRVSRLALRTYRGPRELCSARVTRNDRAVGRYTSPDAVNWFWIGSHADYDALLRRRRA